MADPEYAPGRRRAVPEKGVGPSGPAVPTRAPTHARPAARPASRPPAAPTLLTGLPPGERSPAHPPRARPVETRDPAAPPASQPPPAHLPGQAATPAKQALGTRTGEPATPRLTPLVRFARQTRAAASATVAVASATVTAARANPATPAAPAPVEPAPLPRFRETPPAPATTGPPRVDPVPPVAAVEAPRYGAARLAGRQGYRSWLHIGWLPLLLVGVIGILLARLVPDLPELVRQSSAVLVSTGLGWALAVRTGGRPDWAAGLTAVLGIGAVASGWSPLLGGAAVGTGVLAACLAVMSTVPAATFGIAIREAVVASALAWVGAFGVIGYGSHTYPSVDETRFDYTVLALAMGGAFALVYRLGAGLHGLGRRGYVVAGGAVLMLALALAYSQALAHWGSRELVGSVGDVRDGLKAHLGAVPHPIVALLGYPALVWGVFMRARRRQGWWVTAFGVAATAPTTTELLQRGVGAGTLFLGAFYSFVVGIVLGYVAIRVEQSFSGTHGRRARRDEEAIALRPEPGRVRPLR